MTPQEAARRARGRRRRRRNRIYRRAALGVLLLLTLAAGGLLVPNWIESVSAPSRRFAPRPVVRELGPAFPDPVVLSSQSSPQSGLSIFDLTRLSESGHRDSLRDRFRREIALQVLAHRPQEVLVYNGLADFSPDAEPGDALMMKAREAEGSSAAAPGEEEDDWQLVLLAFDPQRVFSGAAGGSLVVPVPEPETGVLLLSGLAGLAAFRRYRSNGPTRACVPAECSRLRRSA